MVLFIAIVISSLLIHMNLINATVLTNKESIDINFNLITVNSIFAGFLFSSITFLIGITGSKTIDTLERITYMDKVYSNLILGFISSIISIIISLMCIFIIPNLMKIDFVIKSKVLYFIIGEMIPITSLILLIYTIIKFLLSMKHITFIISSIRRKIMKRNPVDKDSIERTLNEIKGNR